MRKLTGALLVGVVVMWAPAALAQGSASDQITAEANVLAAVQVTAQQDLLFGNVIPGTNKSVAITDADAGRWLVQGTASAEVSLQFTALPIALSDGTNSLSIVYSGSDAGYYTANTPASATTFDPTTVATANIGSTPAELYVWIGGQVVPDPAQAAGLYQGTITLQATYTGN